MRTCTCAASTSVWPCVGIPPRSATPRAAHNAPTVPEMPLGQRRRRSQASASRGYGGHGASRPSTGILAQLCQRPLQRGVASPKFDQFTALRAALCALCLHIAGVGRRCSGTEYICAALRQARRGGGVVVRNTVPKAETGETAQGARVAAAAAPAACPWVSDPCFGLRHQNPAHGPFYWDVCPPSPRITLPPWLGTRPV